MSYDKEDVKKFRIQRSFDTLAEAELLFSDNRILGTVNRLYYACFYAISAFLYSKDINTSTHSGVKISFNKELIKTELIDSSYGKFFNTLFINRFEADYDDAPDFSEEELKKMFPIVESLIKELERLVK